MKASELIKCIQAFQKEVDINWSLYGDLSVETLDNTKRLGRIQLDEHAGAYREIWYKGKVVATKRIYDADKGVSL